MFQKGSDANNGISPNTAWLTFTKLLDSTGISSGDIAYIEPGIYRSFNCKHDFSNRRLK